MPDDDDLEGMEIGRIVILRLMREDDIVDHVSATDNDGDEMPLAEALGMMRLAEDTLIRARMRSFPEDDDD